MRKPKTRKIVVKKRFWHPAVMVNLMRQAQEEDYRRDRMLELERQGESHFFECGVRDE